MENNKCVIIGFGSAGQRHAENAESFGYKVILVTSRNVDKYISYDSLPDALSSEMPEFAIIASPTYRHANELNQCIMRNIPCLIEKPLATSLADFKNLVNLDDIAAENYRVAYCLRYHPMIQSLKSDMRTLGRLYDTQIVSGQYLPWWRPGTDYRKCYSSFIEKGGGVLLDASHEIDMLTYLFGPVKRLVSISKRVSSLEIESDDLCMVIVEMESGQIVQITLDYFNQVPERKIIVNGENGSIHLDLINTSIQSYIDDIPGNRSFNIERNNLFMQELDDFINHRDQCLLPDLNESAVTLQIIDAIRTSYKEEKWVSP